MTEQQGGTQNPAGPPRASESRVGQVRTWTVTLAIAGALLTLMYGVTTHRAEEQAEQHQVEIQHDAGPPPDAAERPPT